MCRRNEARGGAPKRARAPSRASSAAPASRNEARGSQVLRLAASRGGAPKRARAPSRASSACPCQQKRAARLPNAAPGSIKGGGPETRSGTVQSLKCCPSKVLPLPAETRREAPQVLRMAPKCCAWQHQGGAPKRARAPSRGTVSERVCVCLVCVSESTWVCLVCV